MQRVLHNFSLVWLGLTMILFIRPYQGKNYVLKTLSSIHQAIATLVTQDMNYYRTIRVKWLHGQRQFYLAYWDYTSLIHKMVSCSSFSFEAQDITITNWQNSTKWKPFLTFFPLQTEARSSKSPGAAMQKIDVIHQLETRQFTFLHDSTGCTFTPQLTVAQWLVRSLKVVLSIKQSHNLCKNWVLLNAVLAMKQWYHGLWQTKHESSHVTLSKAHALETHLQALCYEYQHD